MEQSNVTQTILNTINYIFETLLSSIDNRLYGILDDLTFVSSDILHDNYFSKIFGTSTSNGILYWMFAIMRTPPRLPVQQP